MFLVYAEQYATQKYTYQLSATSFQSTLQGFRKVTGSEDFRETEKKGGLRLEPGTRVFFYIKKGAFCTNLSKNENCNCGMCYLTLLANCRRRALFSSTAIDLKSYVR